MKRKHDKNEVVHLLVIGSQEFDRVDDWERTKCGEDVLVALLTFNIQKVTCPLCYEKFKNKRKS